MTALYLTLFALGAACALRGEIAEKRRLARMARKVRERRS